MNAPVRRLLLVHAHPDDETIGNGATMARYVAEGAGVTVLTATLGEFGEIIPAELAELEWDKGDQLGGYRMGELAAALTTLGVSDHRYLGGPGRFHDSGMIGTSGNDAPRSFWRAASDPAVFRAAVGAAVAVVRHVRPQVVVTYDPNGGYGHPDHVMAHRVTMAAVDAAADPGFAVDPYLAGGSKSAVASPVWSVSKVYWNALSGESLRRGLDALAADAAVPFQPFDAAELSGAVDDELITTVVDARDQLVAKTAALRAHATQVRVVGPFFALSNGRGMRIEGTEHYRLVRGVPGGPLDPQGRETDLFGGLDLDDPALDARPDPGAGPAG
ncbi:MAG: N-acetyl-1-D-myo-inositol-2-amino-2-deoxy-alpha-D-glucopyranoside deacetylase [Actinomycetota bacterium]|nr:N-acetyl-1-D-myo-inositol-2-amino-2-deoxy-alpha-D-glucopyranoside deacetylase [Actinomycetota bacterium]